MYYNLKGEEEWLFKQSYLGGDEHIVLNFGEYEERFAIDPKNLTGLNGYRVQTYCGRDLKFNPNWSTVRKHSGILRRGCVFCFTERERAKVERPRKERTFSGSEIEYYEDDLPF